MENIQQFINKLDCKNSLFSNTLRYLYNADYQNGLYINQMPSRTGSTTLALLLMLYRLSNIKYQKIYWIDESKELGYRTIKNIFDITGLPYIDGITSFIYNDNAIVIENDYKMSKSLRTNNYGIIYNKPCKSYKSDLIDLINTPLYNNQFIIILSYYYQCMSEIRPVNYDNIHIIKLFSYPRHYNLNYMIDLTKETNIIPINNANLILPDINYDTNEIIHIDYTDEYLFENYGLIPNWDYVRI